MSRPPRPKAESRASGPDAAFFWEANPQHTSTGLVKGASIFAQGDAADAVYFVKKGRLKVTVTSEQGKEAIIAILGPGDLLGEGGLIGQPLQLATATGMTECVLLALQKPIVERMLRENIEFSNFFLRRILTRQARTEADLVDQLFNSTERRLARALLLLANFGQEGDPQPVIAKISQEALAEMIGTTRSRVSQFMNKFRRLGFIDYNGSLEVHTSLLNFVLNDPSRSVSPPE